MNTKLFYGFSSEHSSSTLFHRHCYQGWLLRYFSYDFISFSDIAFCFKHISFCFRRDYRELFWRSTDENMASLDRYAMNEENIYSSSVFFLCDSCPCRRTHSFLSVLTSALFCLWVLHCSHLELEKRLLAVFLHFFWFLPWLTFLFFLTFSFFKIDKNGFISLFRSFCNTIILVQVNLMNAHHQCYQTSFIIFIFCLP